MIVITHRAYAELSKPERDHMRVDENYTALMAHRKRLKRTAMAQRMIENDVCDEHHYGSCNEGSRE